MKGLVSVIIPALNEAESIQATIAAARRDYTPDQLEILVADGGSSDGTRERVPPDETLIETARGRALQMNAGARASHGEILVFCHADSLLPAGWRESVMELLSTPGVSGGTFQVALMPDAHWWLRWHNRKVFPAGWPWMFGDQGQFMTRATFEQIGGFPEIPLMEDVEMSRALQRVGRPVRSPLRIITSSRRFLERGVLKQWAGNWLRLLRYVYLGATPEQIARTYGK
jgi:rSAM/selenodomain-associated transferase 2